MKQASSYLIALVLSLCIFVCNANPTPLQARIDSVKVLIISTKDNNKKANLLNQLSRFEKEKESYKESVLFAKQASVLATTLEEKAKAFLNIAISERELGHIDTSLYYIQKSLFLLETTNELFTQAEAYDNLGHIYIEKQDLNEGIRAHNKALEIRKQLNYTLDIGNSYTNIAEIYLAQNNYLKAIENYEAALKMFLLLDNNWKIAYTAANLGICYKTILKHDNAIKNYSIALEYYKKSNNFEGMEWIYSLIGELYAKTDDHKQAPVFFHKALALNSITKNSENLKLNYNLLGNYYLLKSQLDSANKYYLKILEISLIDSSITWLSLSHLSLGHIELERGNYDEALILLGESIKLSSLNEYNSDKHMAMRHMAYIYYLQGRLTLAKEYIEQAIEYFLKSKEKDILNDCYKILSFINESAGDYKSALDSYKLHKLYLDSTLLEDASKTIMRYDFEKREAEIKQQKEQELNRKAMVANTTYSILSIVIVFIAVILYSFWIRNKKLKLEKENIELQRREAELAKNTEAFKSRFLSNISHEFRTPLTLINGHLEILKKEGSEKNQQRYNEMEYSGQRLLQLINQLLDLTKIEDGKYSLYFKKGNLTNEIQNYIQAFYSIAEQKGVQLVVNITQSAQEISDKREFAYSSEAIASTINNLLSNALKYTSSNGVIKCDIDFKDNKLYIIIKDNGIGIPENDLPYIFDRFYQVKNNNKPIYEGSGIGLAILKELAQLHGGDIKVENNETGGCSFTIILAQGIVSDALPENTVISTIPQQATIDESTADTENPIILIIEDQPDLRKLIVDNLSSEFQCLEAANGKIGIEMAIKYLPELIISDVMMPEVGGLEVTKALKNNEITSHIPIILLTAKAALNEKLAGLETGADDYLTKPFSISELMLRVKNKLNHLKAIRDKFSNENIVPNKENIAELNTLDQHFIEKLNNLILKNIENNVDVTFLASEIGLSNSQLTRKLKALIGTTPANFIKNIQLNAALQLLKEGYSVSEASWKAGFSEPAYFTRVFKKHFGFLPSEVK